VHDVTRILCAVEKGDPQAAAQLLPLVYDDLRRLAAQKMAQEKPGQTLNPTALVHEAYLRLVGDQQFNNRGHFFAAAAEAMRRILVERARRNGRLKHGGGRLRLELLDHAATLTEDNDLILALEDSLTRLETEDPGAAKIAAPIWGAADRGGSGNSRAFTRDGVPGLEIRPGMAP
jgi:RNA polymerase sigma factor (TIGR02999 family)